MKKYLLTFVVALLAVITFAFTVGAEEITVVDGTDDITLGECVIEGLDREIPTPSKGFTFVLNTETQTARITAWANASDATLGRVFSVPSTVTYNGTTYTVIGFSAVGRQNGNNKTLVTVAIPDTVTSIPNNAFDDCRALKHIYVGSGVETIGKYCFRNAGFTASSDTDSVTGDAMGNVEEFIWKTTRISTLSEQCFYHMDFNVSNVIEFAFDKITKYESACLAYNGHAFQSAHMFNRQLFIDKIDLRGAELASDAFVHAAVAETIIVNADQVNIISPQILRGQGTAQPSKYSTFVIYGGKTAETAVTLTGGVWTANAYYWYPGDIHMKIVFKGFVNAYDGTDGLENQNGYGRDVVDYFFESEDTFNHYINSLASTTNKETTYTRYAKNSKGYFNVCVNDGTHSFKAYNLKYTAATETEADKVEIVEYIQASFTFGYPELVTVLDGKCTESTLCMVCDYELEKGLEHDLKTTVTYENGYLLSGVKSVACQRESCDHKQETITKAIFEFKGYSINDDNTELCIGYYVNNKALLEYNAHNDDLVFGVVAAIIFEGEELSLSYNDKVEANLDNTVIANVNTIYTGFEFKLSGFKDYKEGDKVDLKALNLVMSAYVYDGKFSYLGSLDSLTSCESTPQTITFAKIQAKMAEQDKATE